MHKIIKNQSFQGLSVQIKTPEGKIDTIWMSPRDTYVINEAYISKQLQNLCNRKMLSISNYN